MDDYFVAVYSRFIDLLNNSFVLNDALERRFDALVVWQVSLTW
jgi:hypothetical protein